MSNVSLLRGVLCVLAAASLCLGCGWDSDPDDFTEADLLLMRSFVLTGPRAEPSNEFVGNAEVSAFGQAMFFEKLLSPGIDGGLTQDGGVRFTAVACTDCHSPQHWFSDSRSENRLSRGTGLTKRNSPSLVNVAAYGTFGWDGRADTLWGQCHQAYDSPATMAGKPALLLSTVRARYPGRYELVFGEPLPLDGTTGVSLDRFYVNVLKAWAAYLTKLQSTGSPFDRFALGEREALTGPQRRGLKLFIGKAGCVECHRGPNFTDDRYHSIGIGQSSNPGAQPDSGRYEGLEKLLQLHNLGYRPMNATLPPVATEEDRGRFRTKSLRQVSQTAPYFHAGQAATLKDVVWFYNQGGDHEGLGTTSPFLVPLGLSDTEQAELVAFLEALTGEEVDPALRCDASAAGPVPRSFEVCR